MADAPIANYQGLEVTKGVGRFGPFIKWNGMFINVNKKYDFDHLSSGDIQELIEDKLKKESEKVVHDWADARDPNRESSSWGTVTHWLKGKTKIELSKDVDAVAMTLEQAQALIEKQKPAKAKTKTTTKSKTTTKTKAASKPKTKK